MVSGINTVLSIIADYLSSASSHWHLVVFSVLLMELIFRSTSHQARECQGGGYEGYFGSGPYLSTCLREFLWLPTVCHACTLEIQIWWSQRSSNTITKWDLRCLLTYNILIHACMCASTTNETVIMVVSTSQYLSRSWSPQLLLHT